MAFGLLFDAYAGIVYRHAVQRTGDWATAEEVVSLTFLEAWRLRERLLPEGGSPLPWLLGIATNVLRNMSRAARRHREALQRLPAPATPDLTAERHRRLREHFMQELTQPRTATRAGSRAAAGRRRSRPMLALAAGIVAVGLAAAGTMLALDSTPETRPAPILVVQQGDSGAVRGLLDRIALAAGVRPAVTVGTGQFLYIKSNVSFMVIEVGAATKVRLQAVHTREIWLAQDPKRSGLLKENGRTTTLDPGGPTNEQLVGALPADPSALLAKVYADTKGQGNGPDQEAFVHIGDLLFESLPSPQVSAALYRAAALVPGVVEIDDAVDAIGRHGVAIARTDEKTGVRSEWIFDPATYAYLGQRSYTVRDVDGIPAGTVTGITAVMERAVVDGAGRTK
ncbi:CU044_5270 family protein [Dactylosporangium darangshiense]|uniref:CU044_5270 family protein n=1 Tax=Dactylosporangium darangshiense TaxID=579108 RepID=UPI0031EEF7A7